MRVSEGVRGRGCEVGRGRVYLVVHQSGPAEHTNVRLTGSLTLEELSHRAERALCKHNQATHSKGSG